MFITNKMYIILFWNSLIKVFDHHDSQTDEVFQQIY